LAQQGVSPGATAGHPAGSDQLADRGGARADGPFGGGGGRGAQDVTAFEHARTAKAPHKKPSIQPKYGAAQSGETIDALFAPLPPVESQGRAWLYVDKQLKPVRLRLGITDGTNTELLGGELQADSEVVTGVIMNGTRPTAGAGAGNPLLPQRGGGPGRGR
jgi:hypothetical protein